MQEIAHYPALTRELKRCGWMECPLDILEGELYFQTFQGGCGAPCALHQNEQGRRLLLIGLEQVTLPPHEELFSRFLNLPLESRMALSVTHLLGEPDWLLLLTSDRLDLYRLPEELHLVSAHTPDEIEDDLLPALAALARGREDGLNPGASHLPGAETFGGWLRHWTHQIAATLRIDPSVVERLLWKWVLMLQTARRTEGCDLLGGWGLACERQAGRWTVSYNALNTVEELGRALELFDENFSTRLLPAEPARRRQEWLQRLEDASLLDRLRAELLMHTQDLFEPETVAWMFTDLAREQEGWRREMAGDIAPVRQSFRHEGWSVVQPMTCDVRRYGLTATLRDAERLARYLADLNLFMRQRKRTLPQAATLQMDLFCQNPRGIGPGGELDDGVNYLFGEALRLRGVEPERRFGVGVTFLLKALALVQKLEWPFAGVNTLDKLF